MVGHLTRDFSDVGWEWGGTVLYAALTARRLGQRVAVVTSAEVGTDVRTLFEGAAVYCKAAEQTTAFRNLYREGRREQRLLSRAADLLIEDVPLEWRAARLVLLGPVAREIAPTLPAAFSGALVGLCLQGFLRRWDSSGWVRNVPALLEPGLVSSVDVALLSEGDLAGEALPISLAPRRFLVLTRGEKGASVREGGHWSHYPAFAAREVEPTGVGDAFAAAFMVELWRSDDAARAARVANCWASFVVEGVGAHGVPTMEAFLTRWHCADRVGGAA